MIQILFVMPVKCLFIALLFIFCSCSFIQKTTYFDSGNSSNWKAETKKYNIGVTHNESTLLYDSSNNKVGIIRLEPYWDKPLFFGPPLVPFLPVFLLPFPRSGNLFILGEIAASDLQQLNGVLNDSLATVIINEKIKLPAKIRSYYDSHYMRKETFDTTKHISITCNYPAKKIRSLKIIPSNYILLKAFADTKFIRKRKIQYNPFFFQLH
jgi:hypothetical protein